jgi:hypothetical protein
MPAQPSPTSLASLALAAALVLSWPAAAQPASQTASRATATASPASTSFLAQAWDVLVGLWEEIGCGLDPNGFCTPAPVAEIGCGLDPSGLCAPGTGTTGQEDIGCGLDPDGAH